VVPLGINLVLISLGLSTAWRVRSYTGLVPLFGAVGYTLINAIVRNSGGRYILPIDWISYCYFAIGISVITRWGISTFWPRWSAPLKPLFREAVPALEPLQKPSERPSPSRWRLLGIASGCLLFGLTMPILEKAIPHQFANTPPEARAAELLEMGQVFSPVEKEHLKTYLENGGAALYGRALYPRFHRPDQMGSVWYFYQDRPYANLDFYLSSPQDIGIVLPVQQPPVEFPHGVDALVLACPEYLHADALVVVLFNESGVPVGVLWRSPKPDSFACPLPPP
jgi:hypothetical protein